MEVKEHGAKEVYVNEVGRRNTYDELQSPLSKYEIMTKLIGGSSTTNQLLHRMNLPYKNKIMAIHLPSFKTLWLS